MRDRDLTRVRLHHVSLFSPQNTNRIGIRPHNLNDSGLKSVLARFQSGLEPVLTRFDSAHESLAHLTRICLDTLQNRLRKFGTRVLADSSQFRTRCHGDLSHLDSGLGILLTQLISKGLSDSK